jgi:GAF domain-containing protein
MRAFFMEPFPSRDQTSSTAPRLHSNRGFPGEDGGHSLAEIARRDLDAALQLLADRAQYITGASGAAIALRRRGKKDMLCRASTGSNAPELGALLSTEFGLSGESVRTRQPLRCDDAERDARVNREVCRQLGIASVVVMPVVNDDEVLGVFELFSGKVNAFGERDLSAVQRLSEMVEIAVRLAEAVENLPQRLRMTDISAPTEVQGEDNVLGGQGEELVLQGPIPASIAENLAAEELVLEDGVLDEQDLLAAVAADTSAEKAESLAPRTEGRAEDVAGPAAAADPVKEKIPTPSTSSGQALPQPARAEESAIVGATVAMPSKTPKELKEKELKELKDRIADSATAIPLVARPHVVVPENVSSGAPAASPQAEPVPTPSPEAASPRKRLFWSAALSPAADAEKPEAVDQSHVPPVLRTLRKCDTCGFPVSAGRVLCVECEEKKWRGQLRGQLKVRPADEPQIGIPAAVPPPAAAAKPPGLAQARAFAAAAQSDTVRPPQLSTPSGLATSVVVQTPARVPRTESKPAAQPAVLAAPAANPSVQRDSASSGQTSEFPSPDFVLSAGLRPQQSWLSGNKYVIGVLLVVAAAIAAFVLLR